MADGLTLNRYKLLQSGMGQYSMQQRGDEFKNLRKGQSGMRQRKVMTIWKVGYQMI